MEKEFIPYEQALSLKELGFDEKCISVYLTHSKQPYPIYRPYTNNENTDEVLRPTFSQAFRFFREKYKLYHEIRIGHDEDKLWWNYYIYKIELGYDYEPINDDNESGVDTYDEAELKSLKKLIEIVKQKNE